MSLLRKAFWPAAMALGILVFLGAIGQGSITSPRTAQAAPSVVNICGPEIISEDETVIYAALIGGGGDVLVDLDDKVGDSDITSVVMNEGSDIETEDEEKRIPEYVVLDNPTDILDMHLIALDFDGEDEESNEDYRQATRDIVAMLEDDFGFSLADCMADILDEDDLAAALHAAILECIDDGVILLCQSAGGNGTFGDNDAPSAGDVAEQVAKIIVDDPMVLIGMRCDSDDENQNTIEHQLEDWLFDEVFPDWTENQISQFAEDFCTFFDDFQLGGDEQFLDNEVTIPHNVVIIDVTCEDPGEFDLSFLIEMVPFGSKAGQIEVKCVGEVDEGLITCHPCKVEIVPALGSLPLSLIAVSLLDSDGEPAQEGVDVVTFTTSICTFYDEDGIEDEEGDVTYDSTFTAMELFDDYDENHLGTVAAIRDWYNDLPPEDPDDDSNEVPTFTLTDDVNTGDNFEEDDTLAVILLDCTDEDEKPGIAEVCFDINIEDQDVDGCVKVTVVGPPAKVTAAASPASVICGEKATIIVDVLDAAGQPVSDHTRVEAVTNYGGVLAGTGAVAGLAGPVVPLSSTVGETFNGKATIYLLTSDTHTGAYEVVLATGGGGSIAPGTTIFGASGAGGSLGGVFSTAPQVTQVTVSCTQPVTAAPAAPAPTVTAPRTGTGVVTPPNTGDAGLADSTGFSWALAAVAGVVAFSVAGLATLKISRR